MQRFSQKAMGKRIARARGNMSIREVARAMRKADKDTPGCSHQSITLYESGDRLPNVRWVATFCAVTDTDPGWLLWG